MALGLPDVVVPEADVKIDTSYPLDFFRVFEVLVSKRMPKTRKMGFFKGTHADTHTRMEENLRNLRRFFKDEEVLTSCQIGLMLLARDYHTYCLALAGAGRSAEYLRLLTESQNDLTRLRCLEEAINNLAAPLPSVEELTRIAAERRSGIGGGRASRTGITVSHF